MAGSLTGHRKYGEAASCYIENSVEENACTKELQELHKMVKAVKQDREKFEHLLKTLGLSAGRK